MHKILAYMSFIIASLVVVLAFITSTTYVQLVIACLFYPPLTFFAFKLFPRKPQKEETKKVVVAMEPVTVTKRETVDVVDIDKRAFLKLIGAAGLSLFLFSIFSKRAEALFFGRAGVTTLEDPDGNKIYPAERQPTDGYQISEVDDEYVAYYGFINKTGGWYIMKEDPDIGSIRYAKGSANFTSSWTNREQITFDYY